MPGPLGPGHGFITISFLNTRRNPGDRAASGFTEFRMLRPGYTLDGDQVFTDKFLGALRGIDFEAIRFMPFVGANGVDQTYPTVTDWSGPATTQRRPASR